MKQSWSRRIVWAILASGSIVGSSTAAPPAVESRRPNVLLIVTDDQGHGDLGFHGNTRIRTPRLDVLARESTRLGSFYVSPVCSPTRSSLMTGRYHYRTGVVDTFRGRSMMHPDEVTLAEILTRSGYRTGIFGKWHLGDNAPLRAMDQGFQESLVLRGGGIGQPSDPPGTGYFNPILAHNGTLERSSGYCSDVFADATIRFLDADRSKPFFAYLAFNAPHEPLDVPDAELKPYLDEGPNPAAMPGEDPSKTARVYAMVSNIDRNVGRVLDRLDALGLASDTIVIFLTDNGPQHPRYNSGLRDRKGSIHDGGIKVPCFVRWPGSLEAGRVVGTVAAHIDITPTLLAACGVETPRGIAFDGRNLLPLLKGQSVDWPERTLYFQWHRGDVPEIHRAFAARSPRFKLAQPLGVDLGPLPRPTHYQLFDMLDDPLETRDIADRHPEVVSAMLQGYESWFRDVESTRHFEPPRIHLGSDLENPVTLTRQDWRGEGIVREPGALGGWEVDVRRGGRFDVKLLFGYGPPGTARVELSAREVRREVTAGSTSCRIENLEIPQGPGRLRAWVERPREIMGVLQIEMKRRD